MRKHISYPKIPQFRNVVSNVNHAASYRGQDEDGNPVYEQNYTKPVIKMKGTVKVHGTNAGVCYNANDGIYTQSRNNSFEMDEQLASHQGFTAFVKLNEETFLEMFHDITVDNNVDTHSSTISIYGEWAGKGIQKGVAVSDVNKFFVIFGVKITPQEGSAYWVDYTMLSNDDNRIFNIDDFGTYEVEVDFAMPSAVQNDLIQLTNQVEEECPVGKKLGASGVGEGIVWSFAYKDSYYRFKVKGEKHSVTKVKKLAEVDVEKLNSITEFVDYAMTPARLDQGIENVYGDEELNPRKLGDLMRWLINDIIAEELDTLAKNNLEPKDVNKYISTKAREMFFVKYNKV